MSSKGKYSSFFVSLVGFYVAILLTSNIAAFKLIEFGGVVLTGGTIMFPITYILCDVFAEVYGYKKAKDITILGFFCSGLMIFVFQFLIVLPYPEYFAFQNEFSVVLSKTPRLFIAGLIAFLLGQLSNAFILNYIKNNTKITFLWFRIIISTLFGELIDTTIFLSIAFINVFNYKTILFMIICQTLVKVAYEIIILPLTYKAIIYARNKEDVVDE